MTIHSNSTKKLLQLVQILGLAWVIAGVLTKTEFDLSITTNGYSAPDDQIYRYYAENTANFSREESAMLIAQLIHESGGFVYTEQIACSGNNSCEGIYDDGEGLPNRSYHGRGYIQLSYAGNYRLASLGLGWSERYLLEYPELVANDKSLAMRVSSWYWLARVRPLLSKGREDWFGLTTLGINPDECVGVNRLAKRRFEIYGRVAEVLNISEKAKENGCYN